MRWRWRRRHRREEGQSIVGLLPPSTSFVASHERALDSNDDRGNDDGRRTRKMDPPPPSHCVGDNDRTISGPSSTTCIVADAVGGGGGGVHPVTIYNLRTVAPHYGELLALLVYLTWLLHVGLGFETCLVPLSFGKIYHSLRGTLQYVAAPLLVPARGSSLRW